MVQIDPGWLNVSNWLCSAQGEAGRDGLSLPGPPGPPGPPGQILNLQDVSSDNSCTLTKVDSSKLSSSFLHCCCLQLLLLNETDGEFNVSGIFDAQGVVVSITRWHCSCYGDDMKEPTPRCTFTSSFHGTGTLNGTGTSCEHSCCFLTGSKGWPGVTRTCWTQSKLCFVCFKQDCLKQFLWTRVCLDLQTVIVCFWGLMMVKSFHLADFPLSRAS